MDSARLLTRGSPVGMAANLSLLHPARGFFTGVTPAGKNDLPLLGQVVYHLGGRSARLSFIAPGSVCDSPNLPGLLEGLARQAGEWGAFHVLGELEEVCPAFESMRMAGFSVYAWQRVWRLPAGGTNGGSQNRWQPVREEDEWPIRNLFQNLVPPLAQSAEPLTIHRPSSLVYRQNGEIMAYVEGVFGPRGIYLTPLIHPDIEDEASLLKSLPAALGPLLGRPIYLAVRSYQAWLENTLTDLDAKSSPRQALMVKHLTLAQRALLTARLVQIEGRQAEPAKSVAQNISHPDVP